MTALVSSYRHAFGPMDIVNVRLLKMIGLTLAIVPLLAYIK